MELGMIGLGRMGAYMTKRLLAAGHAVVAYDRDPAAVQRSAADGAIGVDSLESLVARLAAPRAVWVMVPSGEAVDQTVAKLTSLLKPDDILIDGGNSNFRDTLARSEGVQKAGIHFVDVGTSGGIWGLAEGYCLMIGGDAPVRAAAPTHI
jgi:6-phosphogluconate dehydrogenase